MRGGGSGSGVEAVLLRGVRGPHVPRQVAPVPRAVGAAGALEGLLPRVDPQVLLKVGSEGEALAAVAAGVPGVGGLPVVLHVTLEGPLVGHQLEAHRASHLPRPAPWLLRHHQYKGAWGAQLLLPTRP